jgi:hypothetical protein
VAQYTSHGWDRYVSVLKGLPNILDAGAEQLGHKAKMITIILDTSMKEMSPEASAMVGRP